jgi:hypothetical protein
MIHDPLIFHFACPPPWILRADVIYECICVALHLDLRHSDILRKELNKLPNNTYVYAVQGCHHAVLANPV